MHCLLKLTCKTVIYISFFSHAFVFGAPAIKQTQEHVERQKEQAAFDAKQVEINNQLLKQYNLENQNEQNLNQQSNQALQTKIASQLSYDPSLIFSGSKMSANESSCSNVCKKFFRKNSEAENGRYWKNDSKHQSAIDPYGVDSKGEANWIQSIFNPSRGWSSKDDAVCDSFKIADIQNTAAPTIQTAIKNAGGTQDSIGIAKMRCDMHGGQIEGHCMGFELGDQMIGSEIELIAWDAVAATACGISCFSGAGAVANIEPVCQAAACAASIREMVEAWGLNKNTSINGDKHKIESFGLQVSQFAAIANIPAQFLLSGDVCGFKGFSGGLAAGSAGAKQSACLSAATFASLAGIRGYSIYQAKDMKHQSCENIAKLVSEKRGILASQNSGNESKTGSEGTQTPYSSTSRSSANGNSQFVGGNKNSDLSSNLETTAQNSGVTTNTPTGFNPNSINKAAIDGGALSNSGLANQIAPRLQGLSPHQLKEDYLKNGFDSLFNKLSGQNSPAAQKAGEALAGIANAAMQSAPALLGNSSGEGKTIGTAADFASYSGGGSSGHGGGKGAMPAVSGNLFEGLFGNKKSESNGKFGNMQFGRAPASGDIYHSEGGRGIFEIVSEKISNVTDRIGGLPRK